MDDSYVGCPGSSMCESCTLAQLHLRGTTKLDRERRARQRACLLLPCHPASAHAAIHHTRNDSVKICHRQAERARSARACAWYVCQRRHGVHTLAPGTGLAASFLEADAEAAPCLHFLANSEPRHAFVL